MTTGSVSAVLFAKDARRVARFYAAVFGATGRAEDPPHATLDVSGFQLRVHEIPAALAQGIVIADPPVRRETGALRLNYVVADVAAARDLARLHGGQIDAIPPAWADPGTQFFLGYDPEGNVFGVSVDRI